MSVISVLGGFCGSGALSLPAHGLYLHSTGHAVWRVTLEVGHFNKFFLGLSFFLSLNVIKFFVLLCTFSQVFVYYINSSHVSSGLWQVVF